MSIVFEPQQLAFSEIYKPIKVLSLGAGQQSTALALMSVENK